MHHALEVTQSVHGVVRAVWHADPWEGVVLGEGGHLAPDDEVPGVHRLAEHDGSRWRVHAWPHWVGRAGAATAPVELDLPDEGGAVEVVLGSVTYRLARVTPLASLERPVEGSHMAAFAGIFLAALGTTGVFPAASAAAVTAEVRRESEVLDLQALLGTPRESGRAREGEALRRGARPPPPQHPEPEPFVVAAPAWEAFATAPPLDADLLGARLAPVLSLRSVTPTAELVATIPLCGTGPLYTGDVCDPDELGERLPWVEVSSALVEGLLAHLHDGPHALEEPPDNWQRYHRYWEADWERAGWRWVGPDRWSQAIEARAEARCDLGRGIRLGLARFWVTPERGARRIARVVSTDSVPPATVRCLGRVLREGPAPAKARSIDFHLWH